VAVALFFSHLNHAVENSVGLCGHGVSQ